MEKNINVVFASDNYYFTYIYVAIRTLYVSNKHIDRLYVHYIEQNVNKENLQILKKLGEEFGRTIDIIPFKIPDEFDRILPTYGSESKTTYAKFWFASMFPKEDRVLYLDPDVLVMDSIEEMYNLNFNNNLIAGVLENLPEYHRKASYLSEKDAYINGGMVLCNLEEWRKFDLEGKALIRLKDTSINLNYDQGILNELCKGRVVTLLPQYNMLAEIFEFRNASKIQRRYGFSWYYSQEEIDFALNNPVIIHFTGFLYGKPMNMKCDHPYAKHFKEILSSSPVKYKFNNRDIDLKKKFRKFFLHHMPFKIYLILENILDRKRRVEYLKRIRN